MFQSCYYKVLYPIFNMHYIIFYKHLLEEDLHCKQIDVSSAGKQMQAQDSKSQESMQNNFEFI